MVYVSITLSLYLLYLYEEKKCLKTLFSYKSFSGFLGLTIVTQILLGAWVRLTNSGMSCPDWPLCYGFIVS